MVAASGDAEHGGGTGATPLEERVLRLEQEVVELRELLRTPAQAQSWVGAEPHNGVRVETTGEVATPAAERPVQREAVSSRFNEATRDPDWRGGGNAVERGPLFGLFPDGLPPATWWVAMADAGRARDWRGGHRRRALRLRATCQNLPSRVLATARGRWCRVFLPLRFRRVERVAPRALRGGVYLLRARHRVRVRGGGAPERGVARAVGCRGWLRDAVHAALPRLQRTCPGRLLPATARWLFDGLRLQRVAFGVRWRHSRYVGDSRHVRHRSAHIYHHGGSTANQRCVVGVNGGSRGLVDHT